MTIQADAGTLFVLTVVLQAAAKSIVVEET